VDPYEVNRAANKSRGALKIAWGWLIIGNASAERGTIAMSNIDAVHHKCAFFRHLVLHDRERPYIIKKTNVTGGEAQGRPMRNQIQAGCVLLCHWLFIYEWATRRWITNISEQWTLTTAEERGSSYIHRCE